MAEPYVEQVEYLDNLTKIGKKNQRFQAQSLCRGDVHRDGDYHKAVHVWNFAERTQELLLQKRADCKDSSHLAEADPKYVPYDVNKQYGLLFDIITKRYKENNEARSLILQKQLRRFASVSLTAEVVNFLQF
ncbi:hypothetical protein ES288_D13G147300v1 [Gossypium darwinii]|uniref:Uncharacterized protein n=1 Tax=Gossypium darwinii TaxID=34276 RepID=A0A5D1ZYS7_GOSDA|nr:hypothetical protein ES288_D13G147300v1 [Gossypium darwinii]